jgi:phage gpG-like protein
VIDLRIKAMFFDRPRVQRAVSHANRRALSRAGAFVRTRARTSMRKRRGTSRPGQPPYAHEDSLRRMILFGYEPSREAVVVGPAGFRGSAVPSVLEFGGRTTVVRRRRSSRMGQRVIKTKVRIAARPYMAPALDKERPNIPALWRNSVRGS